MLAATLALSAQPAHAQFGLNPKHITSFWQYVHPLAAVSMYSTFDDGIYYFVQNRADVDAPLDIAGWYCIHEPFWPCTPGPTGYSSTWLQPRLERIDFTASGGVLVRSRCDSASLRRPVQ